MRGRGSRFSLTSGGARFGLSVLPFDDYPALPSLPEVLGVVDAEEFAAAVAHVAVAAGRDDTLPTLTGIGLALDGDTMTLAATDRYRFAVRALTWKPGQDGVSADVVVSARRLTEIARSFGRAGMVRLALDAGSVGFELAGMRTTVRLLGGRLPRHDKLFAMPDAVRAITDRALWSRPSSASPWSRRAAARSNWPSPAIRCCCRRVTRTMSPPNACPPHSRAPTG